MSWLDDFFAGVVLQNSGTPLPQRDTINFLGTGFTIADDPANDRTNVTLAVDPTGTPLATPDTVARRDGSAAAAFGGLTSPQLASTGALTLAVPNGDALLVEDDDGIALSFLPDSDGATSIAFASGTTPTITQAQKAGTGAAAGSALALRAQPGQAQVGTNANNNGGDAQIRGGAPGTGGSGAAGAPGGVELFADTTSLFRVEQFSGAIVASLGWTGTVFAMQPASPPGLGTNVGSNFEISAQAGQNVSSGFNKNGGDLILNGGNAGTGGTGGTNGKVHVVCPLTTDDSITFPTDVLVMRGTDPVLSSTGGAVTLISPLGASNILIDADGLHLGGVGDVDAPSGGDLTFSADATHTIVFDRPNPRFEASASIKAMWVGDSITQGFSSGTNVAGFRLPLQQMLRAVRNDVDVIGFLHTYFDVDPTFVAYTGSPPLYAMQRWAHSGYSGKKIEDVTAAYTSGAVATSGQPNIVYLMIGTNNVAGGDSAATMQTKYNTLLDQVHATSPDAIIICCRICSFVAGSTVGGSLAAWNAVVATFDAWLADVGAGPTSSRAYCRYLDPNSTLGAADYISDGVHPNASGFSKIAQAYFDHFDGMFPVRRGRPFPRPFRLRGNPSTASVKVATAALDFVQWTTDSTKSPASADFAVSLDFYPTSLPGSLGVIFQYGVPYTSGIMLGSNGAGLSVYFYGSGAPTIDAATNQPLVANRWHHIVVVGNRSTGLLGVYVNGQPVAIAAGVPAWTGATNLNAFVGAAGGIGGALGYYSNLRFYQGSGVPQNETKACIDAIEREYVDGGPLCSGGSSFVVLNENTGTVVHDTITTNVDGALSSGGGATTGWQVQAHPWDYGF